MTQAHDAHDTPTGTDADQAALDEMAQLLFEGAQTGAAIKDLKGVSDDLLESVYAYAHRFYTDGRLDEAETFFRFLYLYDFYSCRSALPPARGPRRSTHTGRTGRTGRLPSYPMHHPHPEPPHARHRAGTP
ncbi:tetratricopeptide repeat protein [Paracidovorax citrulli]